MEIVALFRLRMIDLVGYGRTRFPAGIYLPLALFLYTAGLAAGWPETVAEGGISLFMACTLVFQFRLWDDLADRERDRLECPDRVLPKSATLSQFRVLLVTVLVCNLGLIAAWKPESRLILFLVLNAVFFLWYRYRGSLGFGPIASYHIVLIKYPVFVYLLGPSTSDVGAAPLLVSMSLVYLCFCIHEVLHDSRLRASPAAIHILALEIIVLSAIASFLFVDLGSLAGPDIAVEGLLAITGIVVLGYLFYRHRTRLEPGRWQYAVFLVGFSWLVQYGVLS
jgi:hypothetical protein